MNSRFPTILFIFFLITQTHSLFSNKIIANFTISGLIDPDNILLDSSAKQFFVWSSLNDEFQIYNINGSKVCFGQFPSQIQQVIWPSLFNPIILPFPGTSFSVINRTTCKIVDTYNIQQAINTQGSEQATQINFRWRGIGTNAVVAISGKIGVWQINLTSKQAANCYTTLDPTFPKYRTTAYSSGGGYIYVVMIDPANEGLRTVRVWETSSTFPKHIYQYSLNMSITSFQPLPDGISAICIGSSITTNDKYSFRLANDCSISNLSNCLLIQVIKPNISKAIPIGEGNAVAFFMEEKGSMELVRMADSLSVQNITFSNDFYFYDAHYQSKVLIVLDSSSRVLAYQYEADKATQPTQNRYMDDNFNLQCTQPQLQARFPFWIIILSVILGLIILVIVSMYVFKEKLPEKIRNKLPTFQKCLKRKPKKDIQQPLLRQSSIVDDQAIDHRRSSVRKSVRNEGFPAGMSDAEIIEAMMREEQRKRQQQLQKAIRQKMQKEKEGREKEQNLEQKAEKDIIDGEEEVQIRESDRKLLNQIQRRRKKQSEQALIDRLVLQQIQKIKGSKQQHIGLSLENTQEGIDKGSEIQREQLEKMKQIKYLRFLEQQQKLIKFPSYLTKSQKYPEIPQGQQQNNPIVTNEQNRTIITETIVAEQKGVDFVQQRKSLLNVQNNKRQSRIEQEKDESQILSKSFFVVKRKNDNHDENQQ